MPVWRRRAMPWSKAHTHKYAHTHTHVHTCTHRHKHTHTHTDTHRHRHRHTHTHTHTQGFTEVVAIPGDFIYPLFFGLARTVRNQQSLYFSCLTSESRKFHAIVSDSRHSSNIIWYIKSLLIPFRDDVKLAQLVRARDCQSRGRRFDSGKNSKNENSNLHRFEVLRPSRKGAKLLFQVKKAPIHQSIMSEVK